MGSVGRDLPGQGQGQDQEPEDQGNGRPEWKPGEDTLRKSEVRWGKASLFVQGLVAVAALGAVIIALDAVDTAREGIELQARENRLSTAISAIGGEQPGERVGGLALLRRHVASQLSDANEEGTSQERLEAHLLYTTALRVFENYLRNTPDDRADADAGLGDGTPDVPADDQADADAGLGEGTPDVPADNHYAAKELQGMMKLKSQVEALDIDALDIDADLYPAPSLDLANVELPGQSWAGIDFSWLDDGHFFVGIDLRGANLAGSIWGKSSLEEAFLQCAQLDGANFTDTDLSGADLRGANISDANFSGAEVDGINLEPVYYDGERPPKGLPKLPEVTQEGLTLEGKWDRDTCLGDRDLVAKRPAGSQA